ncbi:MAG: hypothetical protein ACHP7O_13610 [Burkholderiales bacterium]
MEYVGWRDMKSALRYITAVDPFGKARIEQAITGNAPLLSRRPDADGD